MSSVIEVTEEVDIEADIVCVEMVVDIPVKSPWCRSGPLLARSR